MLLLFVVEFTNGVIQRYPLSCDESRPMSAALAQLRQRLAAPHSAKLDLRLPNGAPLDLNRTPKQLQLETNSSIFVIADCAPSGRERQRPAPADRTPSPQPRADVPEGSDTDDETASDGTCSTLVSEAAGVHSFLRDGDWWKSFVKKPVSFLEKVLREEAVVSVAYPMQLVQAVAGSERLRTRTYNPNATPVPSSVTGMDDATFTRYLSIAMTHGKVLQTEDRYKQQLAFYPNMLCVRHSCRPNSIAVYQLKSPPYEGVIRCIALDGLDEGEEVTVLYPAVDTLGFLLMPRERRHQYLQRKYHFTCKCVRCREQDNPHEDSLTGAYFHVQGAAAQRQLSERMREQFSNLNLLEEATGLPTKDLSRCDAGRLCQFLLDYTGPEAKLQLHPNHWRLSLVRLAYLWHCVRGTMDQNSFNAALQQLQTEARFVPPGHPLSLQTYRRFKLMTSRLPARLAASVQKKALETPGVCWEVLQRIDAIFGSHGTHE